MRKKVSGLARRGHNVEQTEEGSFRMREGTKVDGWSNHLSGEMQLLLLNLEMGGVHRGIVE